MAGPGAAASDSGGSTWVDYGDGVTSETKDPYGPDDAMREGGLHAGRMGEALRGWMGAPQPYMPGQDQASGGYRKLKETGAADDPLYVAKGPIWFDTREEANEEAASRNRTELHLSTLEAWKIVALSMAPPTSGKTLLPPRREKAVL